MEEIINKSEAPIINIPVEFENSEEYYIDKDLKFKISYNDQSISFLVSKSLFPRIEYKKILSLEQLSEFDKLFN